MKNTVNLFNNTAITLNSNYSDFLKQLSNNINYTVIYFDEKFDLNSELYEILSHNSVDRLIAINNKDFKIHNKKILITKQLSRNALKLHENKTIFFIRIYDFTPEDYFEFIIKNLIWLEKLQNELDRKHENPNYIGNIITNVSNEFCINLINTIKALSINNIRSRYSFIYDLAYDYLANEFKNKNYCDFRNNTCIANRKENPTYESMGCCYTSDCNILGDKTNSKVCKYFNSSGCKAQCLPCKFFTCNYLKKKGISFSPNSIVLLKYFFTPKQRLILTNNFFVTKELILDKLQEIDYKPFWLYYITNSWRINII